LEPDDDLRRAIPLEEVRDNIVRYMHTKQAILKPDDDLRSAITKEEFKERAHGIIHDFFANS